MLLKLLKYQLNIEYISGLKMYVAETLIRSYLKCDTPIDEALEYTIDSLSLNVSMTEEKK